MSTEYCQSGVIEWQDAEEICQCGVVISQVLLPLECCYGIKKCSGNVSDV